MCDFYLRFLLFSIVVYCFQFSPSPSSPQQLRAETLEQTHNLFPEATCFQIEIHKTGSTDNHTLNVALKNIDLLHAVLLRKVW